MQYSLDLTIFYFLSLPNYKTFDLPNKLVPMLNIVFHRKDEENKNKMYALK